MITAQRGDRVLVRSCHPGFEGPEGMITKVSAVSAVPASVVALCSSSSPHQWRLLFQTFGE